MDYEKKYNEALEKVKKLYAGANGSLITVTKSLLEKIFPELRESEDEMIRRTLVEYFGPEVQLDFVRGVPIQKIRDWLEKQKEQNPVECLKAEKDYWYICIKDFYAGGKKMASVGNLVQAKGGMYMMGRQDISEWFRRAYFEEVRDAFGLNVETNISPRHEWDKEDKVKLDMVISQLLTDKSVVVRDYPLCKSLHEVYDDMITFLKSLRPSWKPSEEQMKVMKEAIAYFGKSWDDPKQSTLESIYEQLKKL